MSSDTDVIEEFQHRRRATAKAILPWLMVCALGFLMFYFVGDERTISPNKYLVSMAFFVIGGIAGVKIIFIVREKYRCPNCEEIPMSRGFSVGSGGTGYDEEIELNPKQCSHCGARLR